MKSMIKDPHRLLRLWVISLSTLTALAIILRCVNLFFFYDIGIGYYRAGAFLPIAERILMILAVVCIGVGCVYFFRRKEIIYSEKPHTLLKIAAILSALTLVIFTVVCLNRGENPSWMSRLLPILSIIAAAYFLLHTSPEAIPPLPRFITGLALILWLLFSMSSAYFDVFTQMNTPQKLLFQLSCVAGMLFTVSELRVLVSESRPVLYLAAYSVALFFTGAYSVPSLIAGFAGAIQTPDWSYSAIPLFGLFIYLLIRGFFFTVKDKNGNTPAKEEVSEESDPSENESRSE